MKFLVTGGGGQLGREIAELLASAEITHVAPTRQELDITDHSAVQRWLEGGNPAGLVDAAPVDAVIHAAAYTKVDLAETEQDEAYRVNATASRQLAAACARLDIPMVYISTDYVFSGDNGAPYEVDDKTGPISVYGASKLAGEESVRELAPRHYVVRTAGVFGPYGHNFPRAILKAAAAGQPLRVVDDQVSSPTYTRDLGAAVLALLGVAKSWEGVTLRETFAGAAPYGVYHMSNTHACTWFQFATEILHQAGWKTEMTRVKTEAFARPARRPAYSALSLRSIHEVGLYPRPLIEALGAFLKRLRPLVPDLFPGLPGQESRS